MPRSKDVYQEVFHISCQNQNPRKYLCQTRHPSRNYPVIVFTWNMCAHIICQMMHILPPLYVQLCTSSNIFMHFVQQLRFKREEMQFRNEHYYYYRKKRQKEEYQGRQLMEILFAVIFLSKKTTQYFVMGRFLLQIFKKCSSFHHWNIIHWKVFFFLTTAAALVQSLNFSQSLPQSQSCVFICFLWDCRVSLWELFEKNHPIATWFVIKNLKHKEFVIHWIQNPTISSARPKFYKKLY